MPKRAGSSPTAGCESTGTTVRIPQRRRGSRSRDGCVPHSATAIRPCRSSPRGPMCPTFTGMNVHTEAAFESSIERRLFDNGRSPLSSPVYDRERGSWTTCSPQRASPAPTEDRPGEPDHLPGAPSRPDPSPAANRNQKPSNRSRSTTTMLSGRARTPPGSSDGRSRLSASLPRCGRHGIRGAGHGR